MTTGQFNLLIIILLLGFGGYFAHPLFGTATVLLFGLPLLGGWLVWCVVGGFIETQQNRRELAPRMLELVRMDLRDLYAGRRPPSWSGPFDETTIKQEIRELEARARKYEYGA